MRTNKEDILMAGDNLFCAVAVVKVCNKQSTITKR